MTSIRSTVRSWPAPLLALSALLISVMGAATSINLAASSSGSAVKADYSLAAQPSTLTVQAGKTGSSTITATAVGGFTGTVALTASSLPSGVTLAYAPSSSLALGKATQASATLTFSVANSAALGSSTVAISGTAGSGSQAMTRSTTISLTVQQQAGSLTTAASPSTLTLQPGSTGAYSLAVTRSGGASSVSLTTSVGPLPGGVVPSVTSPGTTNAGAVQLSVSSSAAVGTYAVAITTSGGGYASTTNATLVISSASGKPFIIRAPSAAVTGLAPGAPARPLDLVLENPNNQTVNVSNLTVSVNQPPGAVCGNANFAAVQIPGGYPLVLQAGEKRALSSYGGLVLPTLRMVDLITNQDVCKNTPANPVSVALAFSGTAATN